jgi:hypothetical protein
MSLATGECLGVSVCMALPLAWKPAGKSPSTDGLPQPGDLVLSFEPSEEEADGALVLPVFSRCLNAVPGVPPPADSTCLDVPIAFPLFGVVHAPDTFGETCGNTLTASGPTSACPSHMPSSKASCFARARFVGFTRTQSLNFVFTRHRHS